MEIENKLFNPASQPKGWLVENFIVRKRIFEKLFKDISGSTMEYPEQNYILVGERGMGKTTLLLRLKYEIENDPALNTWLIPVYFNEETYDLTSLSNLWEKIMKYLDQNLEQDDQLYPKTNAFIKKPGYEKNCFDLLAGYLKEHKKKLILFIDNFGELFLNNLSENEQHRLREILINSAELRIIGSSAIILEDVYDYSKPFYEFFRIINLESLTIEETNLLLSRFMGNSDQIDLEKNKARIDTLHLLTGGNIRTTLFLYEVLISDNDGSALKDLETILDRITPLYKSKMESFPVQQRKIIDVIAKHWDPVTAAEIASNIRENGVPLATKKISAQISQLEKVGLIEKKKMDKKNNLYQIRERFFNIWYLMRNGDRQEKNRVIWLTRYLEVLYDFEHDGIKTYLEEIIGKLKCGGYQEYSASILADAVAHSDKLQPADKVNFLNNLEQYISLPNSAEVKKNIEEEIFVNLTTLMTDGKYKEVIKITETIDTQDIFLLLYKGSAYAFDEKPEEAGRVINELGKANSAYRFNAKGLLFNVLKKYQEAITEFEKAREQGVFFNYTIYAKSLEKIGNYKKAEEILLSGLANNKIQVQELAEFYMRRDELEKAIETYLKDPELDKKYESLRELAELYKKMEKYGASSEIFRKAQLLKPDEATVEFKIALNYVLDDNLNEATRLLEGMYNDSRWDSKINQLVCLTLSMCYYNLNDNKEKALKYLEEGKMGGFKNLELTMCRIYTWNDLFDQAINILKRVEIPESSIKVLNDNLLFLAAKKQFNRLYDLFSVLRPELQDIAKPFYAYILYNLKDVYPESYLKVSDQMQEVIPSIEGEVKAFEKYV